MLTKKEGIYEKQLIKEMTDNFGSLSEKDRSELIRLKCRNELLSFAVVMSMHLKGDRFDPYKVHEVICDFAQQSADGNEDHKYITISLPPRAGKSTIIGQYFLAWQIGRNPKARFIQASHKKSLVEKNSSIALSIIAHPEYKKIFPKTKLVDKGIKIERWDTTMGGGFLAATPRGGISGFDAGTLNDEDFPGAIIMDDLLADGNSNALLQTAWNWTTDQLLPRALPNTVYISMGTRFHINDVTGKLLETMPEVWKSLNVPALCIDPANDPLGRTEPGESYWEEKYPVKDILMKKAAMQESFDIIYQGIPAGSKGNLLKEDDIIYAPSLIKGHIFFSIDTNSKGKENSDFNAVCVWSWDGRAELLQLIDIFHSRCDFYELLLKMKQLARFWKPRWMIIEDKANGSSLISMLKQEFPGIEILGYNPTRDKVAKFNMCVPFVKRGQVYIYNGIAKKEAIHYELTNFPLVKNNDIVDAFSIGVLFWVNMFLSGKVSGASDMGYGVHLEPMRMPIDTSVLTIDTKRGYDTGWEGATNFL